VITENYFIIYRYDQNQKFFNAKVYLYNKVNLYFVKNVLFLWSVIPENEETSKDDRHRKQRM
jgi:hypothetical protein